MDEKMKERNRNFRQKLKESYEEKTKKVRKGIDYLYSIKKDFYDLEDSYQYINNAISILEYLEGKLKKEVI